MKNFVYTLLLSAVCILPSCKKEGCTDPQAVNYDIEANENNGSCTYEAYTSFWFNQNISNWLAIYNVTSLDVSMNETPVGTMDPTAWKTGPDCGGANFTVTNNLGLVTTKNYTYKVRDQAGTTQFEGSVSLTANDCRSVELVW